MGTKEEQAAEMLAEKDAEGELELAEQNGRVAYEIYDIE